MAKIAEYLKQILSARYGRDVRQSIHDAISAINDESTECWATVEKVPETLAIAAVKDTVSGKDITLEMSSDFVLTDFDAWGNTEQDTTTGKNMLDCSGLTTKTTNGVTFTPVYADNGELEYINVNGTATANTNHVIGSVSGLSGDYILNGFPVGASSSTIQLAVLDSEMTKNIAIDKGDGATFSVAEDIVARIRITSGTTVSNLKFYPMIRLASITDGTYEPYTAGASPNTQYEQPLRQTIISKITTCKKNMTNTKDWKVGRIREDGSEDSHASFAKDNRYRKVNPNTKYTFSFSDVYFIGAAKIAEYDKALNFIKITSVLGNVLSMVLSEKTEYIRPTLYSSSSTTITSAMLNDLNFQLELGEKTEYEPYTESVVTLSEPITLNGIDDVKDNFGKSEKYIQRILKIVVDGKTVMLHKHTATNDDGSYVYYFDDSRISQGDVSESGNANKLLCTHYMPTKNATTSTQKAGECRYGSKQSRVYFFDTLSTEEEINARFAENPMTVYCLLAEPIETPLPDADVEALKNIRTFKGITHVFTDSEVKPDMEVEYVIDTKMYIDKKIAELA